MRKSFCALLKWDEWLHDLTVEWGNLDYHFSVRHELILARQNLSVERHSFEPCRFNAYRYPSPKLANAIPSHCSWANKMTSLERCWSITDTAVTNIVMGVLVNIREWTISILLYLNNTHEVHKSCLADNFSFVKIRWLLFLVHVCQVWSRITELERESGVQFLRR